MKIQNKNTNKRKIAVLSLAGVILLLILASFVYVYGFNGSLFGWSPITKEKGSTIDYSPPTKQELETGNDIKDNAAVSENPKTGDNTTSNSVNPPGENVAISIPSKEVTQDGTLRITTLIERVTSAGTCTLTLTKSGSAPITQVVEVQALANSSTCKGFTVPGLASGTWQLSITYRDGSLTGNASEPITIN